jgi:hypothetical protein
MSARDLTMLSLPVTCCGSKTCSCLGETLTVLFLLRVKQSFTRLANNPSTFCLLGRLGLFCIRSRRA